MGGDTAGASRMRGKTHLGFRTLETTSTIREIQMPVARQTLPNSLQRLQPYAVSDHQSDKIVIPIIQSDNAELCKRG
jgi:hypothetical protein